MAVAKIRQYLTAPRAPRPVERSLGGRRIIADGLAHNGWNDFYHNALIASWPRFFGVLAAAFLTLNSIFALVYWLGDAPVANARPGSFADLFFFSVETTSTVGYGDMHPQTIYGHIVATVENFVGLVLLAVMTGLVFARFSRPRARMIFARNPVITDHEGVRTLVFRLANARFSFISEATAKLWMLGPTDTKEGRRYVGFFPMKLSKSENPSFALSWTLFHPIDADSPIQALSDGELLDSEINFVVSISGLDETSAQMVHARETFSARDIRPEHEFVDLFTVDDEGRRHIDYSMVHETRPVTRALREIG
jgi:inward rectifier potassium channel